MIEGHFFLSTCPPRQHHPLQRLVLSAIAAACADVASLLRTASTAQTGTLNDCGDSQIAADVAADKLVLDRLASAGAVSTVSSEENTAERELGGSAYSVAYDPLDGSSVAGAGWAVGAIFGVWTGKGLVGRTGDEQAAACYAVFGPRTTLVVAHPVGGSGEESSPATGTAKTRMTVDEFLLNSAGKWALSRTGVRLDDADAAADAAADDAAEKAAASPSSPSPPSLPRYFAPANLRAARDNGAYSDLVARFMSSGATLRYTGALVADFHHVLAKKSGVFLNPASPSAPAKLRYLYEVAPLALVAEAVGGSAEDGAGRVLERRAARADERSVVALGSKGGVAAARGALKEGGGALASK